MTGSYQHENELHLAVARNKLSLFIHNNESMEVGVKAAGECMQRMMQSRTG